MLHEEVAYEKVLPKMQINIFDMLQSYKILCGHYQAIFELTRISEIIDIISLLKNIVRKWDILNYKIIKAQILDQNIINEFIDVGNDIIEAECEKYNKLKILNR